MVVPKPIIPAAAYLLIAAKILVVVGLFLRTLRRAAVFLAFALLVVFLAYSVWRVLGKIDGSCGCFGNLFVLNPAQSIVLNVCLLASQASFLYTTKPFSKEIATLTTRRSLLTTALDAVLITATLLGTGYFLLGAVRSFEELRTLGDPPRLETSLSIAQITGDAGYSKIPFTLVEFGDYECPFCRKSHSIVRDLMRRYPTKLRFVFRQMPLTKIHSRAQAAAEVSLAAREAGNFEDVHNALMEQELDASKLVRMQATQTASQRARYVAEIEKDGSLAKTLQVRTAPTFLLCSHNTGIIYHLESLMQVDTLLEKKR